MTTKFLSQSQQVALQQALLNSKLLDRNAVNTGNSPSQEQQAYDHTP